jgi:hypothetical protein
MKRTRSVTKNELQPIAELSNIPVELWTVHIFPKFPTIKSRLCIATVSKDWKKLLYASIRSLVRYIYTDTGQCLGPFFGLDRSWSLDYIVQFTRLEQCHLLKNTHMDRSFQQLLRLKSLNTLIISPRQKSITDTHLKQLTQLTALRIGSLSSITNRGLSGLTNLHILSIKGEQFSDQSVEKLTQLTYLDAAWTSMTDKGLHGLTQLQKLHTRLDANCFKFLSTHTNLVSLHLCNTIQAPDIMAIWNRESERLTNLTKLRDINIHLPLDLAIYEKMTNLKNLSVVGDYNSFFDRFIGKHTIIRFMLVMNGFYIENENFLETFNDWFYKLPPPCFSDSKRVISALDFML